MTDHKADTAGRDEPIKIGLDRETAPRGLLKVGPASRFPCPCCGALTLTREAGGTYELCPVCWWEDDQVQFRDPDYTGGANKASLDEARANFRAFGAAERRWIDKVRPPEPTERP